jgi:hypothetical protein
VAASRSYTIGQFSAGCYMLATGPGAIRERLVAAYRSEVASAHPPGKDIPTGLALRISQLHEKLTAIDGSIAASVEHLSDEDALWCAQEIWLITTDLHASREVDE